MGMTSTFVHDPATFSSSPSLVLAPANKDALMLLHGAFDSFNRVINSEPCWEISKKKLHELEQSWHVMGLSGRNSLNLVSQLRAQIGWEGMVPDQFSRFYRFVFHICKDPQRRHIQVDVALDAWRLVLTGRFRLLDKWCEFIGQQQVMLKVVNEDQWRQVLDFSRTVHEDLSNFDPNGAWAWILDEFVEFLRNQRPNIRSSSMDLDMSDNCFSTLPHVAPMSPRPGSKRRSPDIDMVAQQLLSMPLSSSSSAELEAAAAKRVCVASHEQQQQQQPAQQHGLMMQAHQALPTVNEELTPMPGLQTNLRRVIRTRRSGVSDLVNSAVSDALGFGD